MCEPTAGERRPTVSHCEEPDHPVCALPATPDAGAASEPLSEAEREALTFALGELDTMPRLRAVIAWAESVKAAAATRARAEALREAAEAWWARDDIPSRFEAWKWLRARADSLTPTTPARTIPTTATVRAGLAADTAADNKVRWDRALKGGA